MAGLSAAQMAYVFASAQHETDQGRSMVEYASGNAYEGNDEGPFNLFLIATLIPQLQKRGTNGPAYLGPRMDNPREKCRRFKTYTTMRALNARKRVDRVRVQSTD